MYPSANTTGWFRRRNLAPGPNRPVATELPREVEIYLLVTLAVRPQALPDEVVAHLAVRFFSDAPGVRQTH
jgi:hypothetical protein